MFFSQLSTLEQSFSSDYLKTFDKYLASLTPAASKLITASKISLSTKMDYATCLRLLKSCLDLGLVYKRYAICCPECGNYVKIVDSIDGVINSDSEYCNRCDKTIEYNETNLSDNVETVFSLKDTAIPFADGQQLVNPLLNIGEQVVAHHGNLPDAIRFKIVGYEELYAPTEEEYRQLLSQIEEIKRPQKTTTAAGATLEKFSTYLFGLCKIYRATDKFLNETNQIDTLVRITSYIPDGLFGIRASCFAIECKNESKTPRGDYLSKLHSILHLWGTDLGIIISKMSPPGTFSKLAHDIYLKDGMCFIWFDLHELEDLVQSRKNLLDVMSQKINELRVNATKALSEIGLYD